MWYENQNVLNYSLPIVAYDSNGNKNLLIPMIQKGSGYKIVGYNWFDIINGEYGSSFTWKTPQEAVEAWGDYSMKNEIFM